MVSQNTLLFKKISGNVGLREIRQKIRNSPYSNDIGQGFVIRETSERNLVVDFIFQYPTLVNKFDEKTLAFVKEKAMRVALVGFSLDYELDLLTIFSKSSVGNRLITELGKITEFQMAVDDVHFTPDHVLRKFKKSNLSFNISSLKIKNFSISTNAIGTFNARIGSHSAAKELIEEFGGEISYFGGSIEMEDKKIALGFYESGAVRIYGEEEDIPDLADSVTKILFKGEK